MRSAGVTTVNIHEAKTHLSRLLEQVQAGRQFLIAKSGRPVARRVPLADAPRPKKLGLLKDRLRVPEGFNAPAPRSATLRRAK
jgi:prevent-host-death family protein